MHKEINSVNIWEIIFFNLTNHAMNQTFPNIEYLNYIFDFHNLKNFLRRFLDEEIEKKN